MGARDDILSLLISRLTEAKAAEAAARDARLAIEEEILAHFEAPAGGEGSKSEGALSVAWKVTRKVDTEALQAAWDALPANTKKAFRWKADTDLKQLRALQELDPAAHTAAAQFITTSPAKPAITLKESA